MCPGEEEDRIDIFRKGVLYASLDNFTDQGIRGARETTRRAKAFEQALESAGGWKIGLWWTLGQYDLVVISELSDDETAARLLLTTRMQGNVRTMTMRGFGEDEMEQIVQGLAQARRERGRSAANNRGAGRLIIPGKC